MKKITAFLLKKIIFKKGVKILKNKKGFSLIEIMVGLGLLVIIGGIATTQYGNYTQRAKTSAVNSTLTAINKAVGVCMAVESDADTCLDASINGSLTENPGVAIVRGEQSVKHDSSATAADHVCYWAIEYKVKTGEAAPNKIAKDGIYGVEVFRKSDGVRSSFQSKSADEASAAIDTSAGDKCKE